MREVKMELTESKCCSSRIAFFYLFLLFASFSSAQNIQEKKDSFLQEIEQLASKPLPIIDSTSFDSFIDEDDYKEVDSDALKLAEVYSNWNEKGYNFRAIRAYKINLSNNFYSVVVTVLKGDNEMESILINYDLTGNPIASEMVSYDEIAEGWTRYTSMIEKNQISRTYYIWASEEDFPVMEVSFIKIAPNGEFSAKK